MESGTRRAVLVSLLTVLPALASAGPPLLCFPIETAGAPSLPWGAGWNAPRADYDRGRLAADTTALLGPGTPVLARMETLRRAVLYAKEDAAASRQLLDALRARVGTADAGTSALARFDLGYALEALREAKRVAGWSPLGRVSDTALPEQDGYALVKEALATRKTDPEMEYAAALITISRKPRDDSDAHLRRALAGATAGSPLAHTIAAHRSLWGDRLQPSQASAR